MRSERGQAMLELVLVFPLVLLLVLALLQVAELIVAHMGVAWAARQAARAASVYVEQTDEITERVALRILGPFLPAIPGIETPIRVDQLPAYTRMNEAVSDILGDVESVTRMADDAGLLVGVDVGAGKHLSEQQERIESALETDLTIPPLLGDWYAQLPAKYRWMARAQAYEHMDLLFGDDATDTTEHLETSLGFSPRPVTVTTTWFARQKKQWQPFSGDRTAAIRAGKPLVVETVVTVRSALRIPLAGRLFAHNRHGPPYRNLTATSRFPVLVAPLPEKEGGSTDIPSDDQ